MKRIKKLVVVLFVIALLLVSSFFIFRNYALHLAFEKVQQKLQSRYQVSLSAKEFAFKGIKSVDIKGVVMLPQNSDTLLKIGYASFNVAITDLLFGKIGFNSVEIENMNLNIYRKSDRNNIPFFKNTKSDSDSTVTEIKSEISYRKMVDKGLRKVFRLLKTNFTMKNFSLNYEDSLRTEHLISPSIIYDLEKFSGSIIRLDSKANDTLLFTGDVIDAREKYSFSIEDISSGKNYLPFLNVEKSLKARFEKINGTISFDDASDNYGIHTEVAISGLQLNHWRIAPEDVGFTNASFNGTFNFSDDVVEMDSTSVFKMENASYHLFVSYKKKPEQIFELKITLPTVEADTFFNSLPKGMFSTLKGIQTSGKLSYHLAFKIDRKMPDSLFFDSGFEKKNFRIKAYGAENYSRIGNSFNFEAMDGDRKVRDIVIGIENPMFTPLMEISPYLQYAVLTSEDGSFLYHRGFNEDAFRKSIITNYKEKRFARGGSTITMQLVKNCFLNRNKTVSRKAEEALIVWLIENCGLVTKDRMLEVYLNAIEWGPDVYGIGEASGFYFGKKPSELSLAEGIYLASIIPNPKYFKYEFDKEGNLKPYLANYYRMMASKMLSREWITPEDTTGLLPIVKITGPAKQFIIPVDTILPLDSINEPPDELEILN